MFQKISCPYNFLGILEPLHIFFSPSFTPSYTPLHPQKLKLYDIKSTCIKKKLKVKSKHYPKHSSRGWLVGWLGGGALLNGTQL
jgi:hypothetical protein